MPEGDTIFLAAATLRRSLVGETVTRFESVLCALTRTDADHRVAGRTVDAVDPRGKHLLIAFSGGLTLRTHLRMNGSWHIYPSGARWRRPARDARIVIETARAIAVAFNIQDAELLTNEAMARHAQLRSLGPDLLADDFDADEARRRLRAQDAAPIADVLLSQHVVAGIGNEFKSEILFLTRVFPFTRTAALADAQLDEMLAIARKVMTVSVRVGRRTTRSSLNPNERLWVYGRGGKPCFRCGTTIKARKTGDAARITYWCPTCQRVRETE
jgi:endonuclease-8